MLGFKIFLSCINSCPFHDSIKEVNPAAGFYEEEDPDNRRNPLDRVEKMFHRIPPESYDFILCLAEEEKYWNIW